MTAERLQKILSHAGVASRRRAEELIVSGHISVNGSVVTTLGARADPEHDTIALDGVPVNRSRYRYLAFNKPRGVVTTARDEHGRFTVMQLLGRAGKGLHPVGRLDRDSEGLLILTNDGALTQMLTHPSHEVDKEYLVEVDRPLGRRARERLLHGIEDEGKHLRARRIETVEAPDGEPGTSWLAITLREGKKREIRRMLAQVEREVLTLRRVRIGALGLGELESGRWRDLTEQEVTDLYRVATASTSPKGRS